MTSSRLLQASMKVSHPIRTVNAPCLQRSVLGCIQPRATLTSSSVLRQDDIGNDRNAPHHKFGNGGGNGTHGRSSDRELLLNVLNASTTRRDAKAYLSRFAAEDSATTDQFEIPNTLHLALVLIRSSESLSNATLDGVGQTLSQLARLGLLSVIVLDSSGESKDPKAIRTINTEQSNRLVSALQASGDRKARRMDYVLGLYTENRTKTERPKSSVRVTFADILLRTLRHGTIPVIPPIAYSNEDQRAVVVGANDVMLALTRDFVGLTSDKPSQKHETSSETLSSSDYSIDRVIILDPAGGIPSSTRHDKAHIFINLEQEGKDIESELLGTGDIQHAQNLVIAQQCLSLLPPSSSALLTTPEEAATLSPSEDSPSTEMGVITRRPKNPLIFNLLTDKPTVSSSLPVARFQLEGVKTNSQRSTLAPATFFKRGMPVTMIPDPRHQPWRPFSDSQQTMSLDDPRIDFGRLLNLIEDSFNRPLDVEDYVNRIRNKLAGIIVAGAYEGGALLTWELPPGVPDDGSQESCRRMVPYLDKFAVLKRSQGAGGVADIVFSAMVRTCFPDGVCWRSRKNNPVNKWYFERSAGSWKLPDSPWSMFWTTPNLVEDQQRFKDYESVCRNVQPSWADKKHIVD